MIKKINFYQVSIIILTVIMTVLRFILNEKGRVSPDSIRFMRQAEIFPFIDNTTAPLGYPLLLKTVAFIGLDIFWSSKIVGVGVYFFMLFFTWKKNFYFKEFLMLGALFSFVSIFSFTLSEVFILPFVLLLLYYSEQILNGDLKGFKAYFAIIILLVAMYNIRYSALFIMAGCVIYGIRFYKNTFSKYFITGGLAGILFMALYQVTFVRFFNPDYYVQHLEIGMSTTPELLVELFQGLCTTFNPFIHIADPGGGSINYGIYGIGFLNICILFYLFSKKKLNRFELFLLYVGCSGIILSFFVQYFYVVDAINYRLMAPFSFPIWLIYFKKLFNIFGKFTYTIAFASILTGFAFTMLSRADYLENRSAMKLFLTDEGLLEKPVKFYMKEEEDLSSMQLAELISTLNPVIYITTKPVDSLQKETLTKYKIRQKIKLEENVYQ